MLEYNDIDLACLLFKTQRYTDRYSCHIGLELCVMHTLDNRDNIVKTCATYSIGCCISCNRQQIHTVHSALLDNATHCHHPGRGVIQCYVCHGRRYQCTTHRD